MLLIYRFFLVLVAIYSREKIFPLTACVLLRFARKLLPLISERAAFFLHQTYEEDMNIELKQQIRILDGDLDTPISLYLKLAGNEPGILLESAEVDGRWGRYSVVASKFLLELSCREGNIVVKANDERLAGLKRHEVEPFDLGLKKVMNALAFSKADGPDLPPITRGLYGYLGYGVAGIFEPKLQSHLPPEQAEARLVLPGELVLFDHLYNQIFHISLLESFSCPSTLGFTVPAPPKIGPVSTYPGQSEYMGMVADVKELIRQGEAIQIVVSTRFSAPIEGCPFEVYRSLRSINPSPYMFYMSFEDFSLLGSSPEALVRCAGNSLSLSPIAGTRPRGSTEGEDNLFEEELVEDPKEKAEHVMLVDLGRNDLGRVAKPGSVKVERFMEVEKFSHVMHLTSYLTADLKDGLAPVDVVAATFPAGTVSGAPKVRAMQILAEHEEKYNPDGRGPYAGAIGWLGLDKDKVELDLGLTIRSLWVKDGKLNWQTGAGIVYDSDPAYEWKECQNKAAAISSAICANLRQIKE